MKECKHEWEYFDDNSSIMCAKCGVYQSEILIEEYELVLEEYELVIATLIEALESIVKEDEHDTTYEENFGNALFIAKKALAATPSESLEHINKMVRALEFYAKWECDVLADEGETAEKALAEWRK